MTREKWLRITIPIQAFLVLWQLGIGLNVDRIPDKIYRILHLGGGGLLVALVVVHVQLNWNWVRKAYGWEQHSTPPPEQ